MAEGQDRRLVPDPLSDHADPYETTHGRHLNESRTTATIS
jgi:hypothetical protein